MTIEWEGMGRRVGAAGMGREAWVVGVMGLSRGEFFAP